MNAPKIKPAKWAKPNKRKSKGQQPDRWPLLLLGGCAFQFIKDNKAHRWIYEGGDASQLEPAELSDLGVGTRVILHVTPEHVDFLQTRRIGAEIVRYADFLPYPVHLNGNPASANTMDAPWHKEFPVDEIRIREYARFVSRRFPDTALEVIPIDLETPYRIQGVLYISDRRISDAAQAGTLDIYCKRMFVCSENTRLLPPWAKFVRGVIDSPDVTITASRSDIQQGTPQTEGIQKMLG